MRNADEVADDQHRPVEQHRPDDAERVRDVAELDAGRNVADAGLEVGEIVQHLAHKIRCERRKTRDGKNESDGRRAPSRAAKQCDAERERDRGHSRRVSMEGKPTRDPERENAPESAPVPDSDREVQNRENAGFRDVDVGEGDLPDRRPSRQGKG